MTQNDADGHYRRLASALTRSLPATVIHSLSQSTPIAQHCGFVGHLSTVVNWRCSGSCVSGKIECPLTVTLQGSYTTTKRSFGFGLCRVVVRCSAFVVRRSSFVVRRSSFVVVVRRSSSQLCCSGSCVGGCRKYTEGVARYRLCAQTMMVWRCGNGVGCT